MSIVKRKEADALIGAYYEPDSNFLYPKWHISVEDTLVALYKKEGQVNWPVKGIHSLDNRIVAWIRGYDFHLTLLRGLKVRKFEINTINQGLKLLQAGRVDVLLDYEYDIRRSASDAGIDLSADYVLKTAAPGQKLYIAFANTNKSRRLISIFDQTMAVMAESGDIEKIYVKWGFSAEKFGKNRFSDHQ